MKLRRILEGEMSVIYICSKCGKRFDLGWEGIFDEQEQPICDKCAGVERDGDGYAWMPGQTEMTLVDPDDLENINTITREEAFGGG